MLASHNQTKLIEYSVNAVTAGIDALATTRVVVQPTAELVDAARAKNAQTGAMVRAAPPGDPLRFCVRDRVPRGMGWRPLSGRGVP